MRLIREYVFRGNQAKIQVYIQEHDEDNFVLLLTRPDDPAAYIEVALRADEALLIASMLTQAVAMCVSAYDVDIETDGSQCYGNFTPEPVLVEKKDDEVELLKRDAETMKANNRHLMEYRDNLIDRIKELEKKDANK